MSLPPDDGPEPQQQVDQVHRVQRGLGEGVKHGGLSQPEG